MPSRLCQLRNRVSLVCDPVDDRLDQCGRRATRLLPDRFHVSTRARGQQLADRFGLVLPWERIRRQAHQRRQHEVNRNDGAHQLLDQLLRGGADP